MSKQPRRPRAIKRGSDAKPERVASRIITARLDLRQAGLFDLPPTWIAPAIPTFVREAPAGPKWLHEVKHDGYRTICVVDQGAISIYTRRGHNWAERMPSIARALSALKVRSAVIDGEAIVVGEDGLSDFFALHAALARKSAPRAVLVAFDLMHLDGEDMCARELEDRRAILADVVSKRAPWIQFSESIEGNGPQVWGHAYNMGLEGIISKRRGSPYLSGKTSVWRKTMCTLTAHFAVTGYNRRSHALRLGRYLDRDLIPCGSAGFGLSVAAIRQIRAALDARQAVIVTVKFRGFTLAGELRHPVIRGWQLG
jgi:bifunctional non-homologous end joining protein LigD